MVAKPSAVRLRQGLLLLLGALVFELVVGGEGPAKFYLVPLGLGLAYLAAAVAGGRTGGFWATALVLVPWGLSVLWLHDARPDVDGAGVYLAAVGAGALLAVALARSGVRVASEGVAATILAGGLLVMFQRRSPDLVGDTRTYALLLGAVGLFNVVLGATKR